MIEFLGLIALILLGVIVWTDIQDDREIEALLAGLEGSVKETETVRKQMVSPQQQ